jgi:hypothetical protein
LTGPGFWLLVAGFLFLADLILGLCHHKKKWMCADEYPHEEESSMKGATQLGFKYPTNN